MLTYHYTDKNEKYVFDTSDFVIESLCQNPSFKG